MKNEPCVRLGMRIRPKISEKPADSRNSSPPSVTLLTAQDQPQVSSLVAVLGSQLFSGGIVARIDRLRENHFSSIGPELADVRDRS